MPYGLKESTIRVIHDVLTKNPKISEAVLYGSRAKGTYRNGSDIDLTLKGRGLSTSDAWDVAGELRESNLPYSFDISVFGGISDPDLLEHINRVGVVFYTRGKTVEAVE